MLIMCVIAGVFVGWLLPEMLFIVGQGKVQVPWTMNIMLAFVGGVSTFMLCTKVWGM